MSAMDISSHTDSAESDTNSTELDAISIESNIHTTSHTSSTSSTTTSSSEYQEIEMLTAVDPGPRSCLPTDAKPIEYFNIFFDPCIMSTIVKQTNRHAKYLQTCETTKHSMKNWKPVTKLEMKAFVAVFFEMDLTRKSTLFSYWSKNSRCIPWFHRMFTFERFCLILKSFHLINEKKHFQLGHPDFNPCAIFNPIIEHVNKLFGVYYAPHRPLYIGELMTEIYRPPIILERKKRYYEIKVWMICDVITDYCMNYFCTISLKTDVSTDKTKFLTKNDSLVLDALERSNCLYKGHHLFVNRSFSTLKLARNLLMYNTFVTGTMRRNKVGIPNIVQAVKPGEVKHLKNETLIVHGYPKRINSHLLLFTTEGTDADTVNIHLKSSYRRAIFEASNITIFTRYESTIKRGMKLAERAPYRFEEEGKPMRYWQKITFTIFLRMMINMYVLYVETVKADLMSLNDFASSIISDIEEEWLNSQDLPETR